MACGVAVGATRPDTPPHDGEQQLAIHVKNVLHFHAVKHRHTYFNALLHNNLQPLLRGERSLLPEAGETQSSLSQSIAVERR